MGEPRYARIPAKAVGCRELSGTDWRVFACIALHADGRGCAWPGMAEIASMVGIRRRDVPRSIGRLERLGLLRRRSGAHRTGANVYTIVFDDEAVSAMPRTGVRNPADGGIRTVADGMSASSRHLASAPLRTKQTIEQPIEQTFARQTSRPSERDEEIAGQFEQFWRAYPSRRPHENPKKPARLKFAAAVERGVDPTDVIRGAENYAAYAAVHIDNPRFIKTAEVWLNKECWNEHQRPPEPTRLAVGMI